MCMIIQESKSIVLEADNLFSIVPDDKNNNQKDFLSRSTAANTTK